MTIKLPPSVFAVLFIVPFLNGCSVSSSIERAETSKSAFDGSVYSGKRSIINPELPGYPKYRIFHQGSTGFTQIDLIRQSAMERVRGFCADIEKRPYLIEETISTPPHILGNWPRIEIVFSCVYPLR